MYVMMHYEDFQLKAFGFQGWANLLKLAFRLTEWSFSGTNKMSEMEEWDESGPEIVKRFMYVNRKAPYGTIYALECLEFPTGGFRGASWDEQADVEYTFYGLGILALLNASP